MEDILTIYIHFILKKRKERARDFVTSLGDRVDGFIRDRVDVFLNPAPSDVVNKQDFDVASKCKINDYWQIDSPFPHPLVFRRKP